jgi:hypothetical protein
MSDDIPQQYPRYVFCRTIGSFRYRRTVTEWLRPLTGNATLYRQLGESCQEVRQTPPLVHARIEALLNYEADKSDGQRSLEIIRGALTYQVAEILPADIASNQGDFPVGIPPSDKGIVTPVRSAK